MANVRSTWRRVTEFTGTGGNIGTITPVYRLERRQAGNSLYFLVDVTTNTQLDDSVPEHPFTYQYRVRVESSPEAQESDWTNGDPLTINRSPVITAEDLVRIPYGTIQYTIVFNAVDDDGDILNPWTLDLNDGEPDPDWQLVSLDSNTRAELRRGPLADVITEDNAGNQPTSFTVRVSDQHGGEDVHTVQLEYFPPPPPPNTPPTISTPFPNTLEVMARDDMDVTLRIRLDNWVTDDNDPDESIVYSLIELSGFNRDIEEDDRASFELIDCRPFFGSVAVWCIDITIPSSFYDDISNDPEQFKLFF